MAAMFNTYENLQYPFEEKYLHLGVDLKHFWLIYDCLYSLNPDAAQKGIEMLESFPYKEDVELFEAFKKDADSCEGTAGYFINKLSCLQNNHKRISINKDNLLQEKQNLINNQGKLFNFENRFQDKRFNDLDVESIKHRKVHI